MKWLFGGQRLITIACVFGLTSIAFTSWAVLDPRPLVVIAAMSIGQGIGILGVVAFLIIVLRDLWSRLRAGSRSAPPPPPG